MSAGEFRKNVSQLLKSTIKGKLVEAQFRLKNKINYHLLSELVIEYEFEYTNSFRYPIQIKKDFLNDSIIFCKNFIYNLQ